MSPQDLDALAAVITRNLDFSDYSTPEAYARDVIRELLDRSADTEVGPGPPDGCGLLVDHLGRSWPLPLQSPAGRALFRLIWACRVVSMGGRTGDTESLPGLGHVLRAAWEMVLLEEELADREGD